METLTLFLILYGFRGGVTILLPYPTVEQCKQVAERHNAHLKFDACPLWPAAMTPPRRRQRMTDKARGALSQV